MRGLLKKPVFLAAGLSLLLATFAVTAVEGIRWRAQVLSLMAVGRIDDLSWAELLRMLRPGSPYWLEPLLYTPSPFAGIMNPFSSEEDQHAGRQLYVQYCSPCHGDNGEGRNAPNLITSAFKRGDADWALYRTITGGLPEVAMPPVPVEERQAWQIIGFVKSLRVPAAMKAGAPSFPFPDTLAVSSERLEHADSEPHNWLTYSGSFRGWRHSRLDEITVDNVAGLKLAWTLQLRQAEESAETSPIVVDGVMYVTEPPSNVLAVDAATGRTIWRYARNVPNDVPVCCGRNNRGVAILGERVFIGTLDAHLVALDARSGAIEWEVKLADYREGHSITSAPLAADDKIIVGTAGGDYGTRGFIDAYAAADGKHLWRFYPVPEAGMPGSETWSGDSWKVGGGAPWLTGSFDPELGLIYWGTGNPAPDFNGDSRLGDNLYTSSVVALDVQTGALAWHYQFTPHDEHDWDATQIPVLIDREIDGVPRKLLLWANRNGFYYVLDRADGTFLRAEPIVKQTWAAYIDHHGRPVPAENSAPSRRGTLTSPGAYGGANWWSPTYSPATDTFYAVVMDAPWIYFKETGSDSSTYHEGQLLLGSSALEAVPIQSGIRALDPLTGKLRWSLDFGERRDLPRVSGLLSTAGGVLFGGDRSDIFALDARDGRELWRVNLGAFTNANPMTFAHGGKQMVAVVAGNAIYAFRL